MNILITGGAGFIGSNFVDFVINNDLCNNITVIDNLSTGRLSNIKHQLNKIHFIEDDFSEIIDIDLLRSEQFDVIFHFAALPRIQPSYTEISLHHEFNTTKTLQLIENLIRAQTFQTKFIYSSSSAIYGDPQQIPTPESEKKQPLSPYALQKAIVEDYLNILSKKYKKLKWVILRYFNPYGPRSYNKQNQYNAYSSVVGIFKARKAAGLSLQITGDGSQQRDFIHVKDVAKANWLAFINYKNNTSYNVGTGIIYSVKQIAEMISNNYEFIPERLGEAKIVCADNTKIVEELDWTFDSRIILEEE